MAKAQRVPGIRAKRSLGENAVRVIEVRLGELLSWRAALDDVSRIEELHDMRIAAKRLRYALEMFEVCFSGSKPLLKELTAMQDDLGAIHDLDVLAEVLRARLAPLDRALEEEATRIMAGGDTTDATERGRAIRRLLSQSARDRERVGLVGLLGDAVARRRDRYAGVRQRYAGAYLDDLADRIRSETAPRSPDSTDQIQTQNDVSIREERGERQVPTKPDQRTATADQTEAAAEPVGTER